MRATLILLTAALLLTVVPAAVVPLASAGPDVCTTSSNGDMTSIRCGAVCVWFSQEGTGGGCA